MTKKEYVIGGKKFYLKEYGDLTGFEEEKIDALLTRTGESQVNVNGYEIFPIILVPAEECLPHLAKLPSPVSAGGGTEGGWGFDWRHLKNKQVAEILVDFIVEKKSSQDTMLSYMKELTGQKLRQLSSMKENTAEAETSELKP